MVQEHRVDFERKRRLVVAEDDLRRVATDALHLAAQATDLTRCARLAGMNEDQITATEFAHAGRSRTGWTHFGSDLPTNEMWRRRPAAD
jgi:hypothetical protein